MLGFIITIENIMVGEDVTYVWIIVNIKTILVKGYLENLLGVYSVISDLPRKLTAFKSTSL